MHGDDALDNTTPPRSVFPFFLIGVHFGLLQGALFFVFQIYVTATFMGYFAVVLAWMGGVILSMKLGIPRSVEGALVLSVVAYFALLRLSALIAPFAVALALYPLFAVVVALPAGTFFRAYSRSVSSRSLFLHENNGFVLGLALATFCFVQWGLTFLYLAPILSVGVTLLAFVGPRSWALALLPLTALLAGHFGSRAAAAGLLLIGFIGLLTCFIRPRAVATEGRDEPIGPTSHEGPVGPRVSRALLVIAGCCLVLLQFFITREFSSILAASELTILVVGIAYFSGFSIGYALSGRLSLAVLRLAAVAMFGIHLAILVFAKVVFGYLVRAGLGASALVGLLFMASLCTSSLYSILLPRLIDEQADLSLVSGYTWDLGGAIGGTVAMVLLAATAPDLLWPAYFALMVAMLVLLFRGTRWRWSVLVVGLFVVAILSVHQGAIRRHATEDYYRTRGYDNPSVVFQGHSLYHAVEVLDTFADRAQARRVSRVSFINGVRYFRFYYEDGELSAESKLSEFSYYLASLPAHYLNEALGRPIRVLIMGAGSMYSVRRVAPYASTITIVEIDPLVVEAARKSWSGLTGVDEIDYQLVLDDVKHFLRTTNDVYDLIINDISAPYYLGTTLLHGKELYELVRTRLGPDGLFAEATQGDPNPRRYDSTPMKIIRGVADVFPRFRVVETERGVRRGNQGFIYASDELDLETDALTSVMRADEMYEGTSTYWERSPHFVLHRVTPFSLTNMETLLTRNVGRVERRLRMDDDHESPRLGRILRELVDPDNPRHSRLIAAIGRRLRRPSSWGMSLGVLALAILLGVYRPIRGDPN